MFLVSIGFLLVILRLNLLIFIKEVCFVICVLFGILFKCLFGLKFYKFIRGLIVIFKVLLVILFSLIVFCIILVKFLEIVKDWLVLVL